MDFNKYLLENLLDCYEQYCSCAQEMSQEDIEAMYFDSEGNEMSDEEIYKRLKDDYYLYRDLDTGLIKN